MSNKAQNFVWEHYDSNGNDKLIALKLADWADDNGDGIYPAKGTVAHLCRVSKRTVDAAFSRMIATGWLEVVRQGGVGRGNTNEYRIPIPELTQAIAEARKGADSASFEAEKGATEKGATSAPLTAERVQPTTEKGATRCTQSQVSQVSMSLGGGNGETPEKGAAETPSWLDAELWSDFKRMREEMAKASKKNKPMTATAEKRAIAMLDRMRAEGMDPNLVVEQSVINNWTGLYPLKGEGKKVEPTAGATRAGSGVSATTRGTGYAKDDGHCKPRSAADRVRAANRAGAAARSGYAAGGADGGGH